MKIAKKLTAFILSVSLCLPIVGVTAFAEDTVNPDEESMNIAEEYTLFNNAVAASVTSNELSETTIAAGSEKIISISLSAGQGFVFDFSYSPTSSHVHINYRKSGESSPYNYFDSTNGTIQGGFGAKTTGTYNVYIKNKSENAITIAGYYYTVSYDFAMAVPLYYQEDTKWCWAACAQMMGVVLGYSKKEQTDIVKNVKGSAINEGVTASESIKALEYVTNNGYTAERYSYTLSPYKLATNLSAGLPVVIIFTTDTSGVTHQTVLSGVDSTYSFIRVNNPTQVTEGEVYTARYKAYKYSYMVSSSAQEQYVNTQVTVKNS